MKIYAISGLGADERVFEQLEIEGELLPLPWLKPLKGERIEAYAERMLKDVNTEEPFGLLGVSFGGLIAVEMIKFSQPQLTILISSAEIRSEISWVYRTLGKSKLLRILPSFIFNPPRPIAYWVFGAQHKKMLRQILDDTDLKFAKWAVSALAEWRNEQHLNNCHKICGTKDRLLPVNRAGNVYKIIGGHHFMIVDRAREVSQIINMLLKP